MALGNLWDVTIRGKDGVLQVLQIEAVDRADVFRQLEERRLAAIKIEPAKDGFRSSKKAKSPKRSRRSSGFTRLFVAIVALAVIVILALIAWLVFSAAQSDANADKEEKGNGLISEAQPIKRASRSSFKAQRESVLTGNIEKPVIENADIFLDAKPKPKGREVAWQPREPIVFTNPFESFVASVMTAIPGERFLETDLSDEFDDDFQASLTNRIVITDEDSDEIVAMKQAVLDAREQVKQYVREGYSAREIVLQAREELNKIADYRDNLQEEFNKYLLEEKDPEQVLKYVEEANSLLAEYGAMPLDAPDDIETAYEMMLGAVEGRIQELEDLDKMSKEKAKKQFEEEDD